MIYKDNLECGDIFVVPNNPVIKIGWVDETGMPMIVFHDGASRMASKSELENAEPAFPYSLVSSIGGKVGDTHDYLVRATTPPKPSLPTELFSKVRLTTGGVEKEYILAPKFGSSTVDGPCWRFAKTGMQVDASHLTHGDFEIVRVGA